MIISPDYLAGLIVGEGSYCINIVRQKNKSGEYVSIQLNPLFSLRMNDIVTIDAIQASFEHYGLDVYRNPGVYKRCASLCVSGVPRMRKHLDFFLPLLIGTKLRAAQVVSEFVDRRIQYSNYEFNENDIALVERLRAINGPSGPRLPIKILRDYMLRPRTHTGKGGRRIIREQDIVRSA